MAVKLQRQLSEEARAHHPALGDRAGAVRLAPLEQATPSPVVVVTGGRRRFADRTVLAGIDLRIERGEFVALLGRSGAGKSTLLRALAGLDPATAGIARVPERRAVVFQDARLLPWQRVLNNVALGLNSPDATERALQALGEVGLLGHARAWPGTLSGGEAQRVALARALVREPELLLMDEPFGALDALTRIQMHALLADLRAVHHPAILLVTHDVDEAVLMSDRVVVMVDGHIGYEQRVELSSPRHRRQPGFIELRTELLACLGVDEVVVDAPDLHADPPSLVRHSADESMPIKWKEHV